MTPEEREKRQELLISMRLNIAMTLLKQIDPNDLNERKVRRIIEECTEVLKLEENNVKALFRRASAQFLVKRYDLAQPDLVKALVRALLLFLVAIV